MDTRTSIFNIHPDQTSYRFFPAKGQITYGLTSMFADVISDTFIAAGLFHIVKPFVANEDLNDIKKIVCMLPCASLLYSMGSYLFPKDVYLKKIGQIGHGAIFGYAYDMTIGTLAHEFGHYYAVKHFDSNATPEIVIHKKGGHTTYSTINSFSQAAKYWIGWEMPALKKHDLEIAMAGPVAGVMLATSEIVLAHIFKSRPKISSYLNAAAIGGIASHVFYAATAYEQTYSHSNDFHKLAVKGGIPPHVAILAIVGIPLLTKATLMLGDYCWKAITK